MLCLTIYEAVGFLKGCEVSFFPPSFTPFQNHAEGKQFGTIFWGFAMDVAWVLSILLEAGNVSTLKVTKLHTF